jgi:hypothetical protein
MFEVQSYKVKDLFVIGDNTAEIAYAPSAEIAQQVANALNVMERVKFQSSAIRGALIATHHTGAEKFFDETLEMIEKTGVIS